jgi:hypothetical protein
MNLLQIRKLFIEQVGNADLVHDYPDCADDNGADLYINEGQKFLDCLLEVPGSRRAWPVELAEGDYKVEVKGLRVLENVHILNTDGMTQLNYLTSAEMRTEYPSEEADVDHGTPAYYTEMIKIAPELWRKASTDFTTLYPDLLYGKDNEIDGILFMPPSDAVYTMEISGIWFSKWLQDNRDVSWWSINKPFALVNAAALMVEMFYGNSAGVSDRMQAVELLVKGIDHDAVKGMICHNRRIVG